ncbi:MAG: PQQ-binding-like beta-propeller repeat protein [Candidatus Aenigmarchaeota archaeon]|nr:PQQ-binding-like beta-propeller repeat protein [Candidatus Aenigmarchaeota archaeon]
MERYIDKDFSLSTGGFMDQSIQREFELFDVLTVLRENEKDAIFRIGEGGSIGATPVIKDGVLYFGSCDKNFYAVEAATGRLVWKFRTDGPVCICRGCAIAGGRIYFGSYDHYLYCLGIDGSLIWRFKARDIVNSTPLVREGIVYFGSKDQNMYALDAEKGTMLWKFWTPGSISASPVWDDGIIYFGSFDKNLYAISAQGKLLWKYRTDDYVVEPVAVSDGIIYLPSTDRNLYALSAEGKLLWKYRTFGPCASMPVARGGRVYFGCSDHNLYVLDAGTGRLLWKFKTRNIIYGNPAVTDDRVYVCSCDQNLYALDLDGRQLWKYKTQGFASSAPSAAGVIYFGSWDCHMYAVSSDGMLLWKFKAASSTQAPVTISLEHMQGMGAIPVGPAMESRRGVEEAMPERRDNYGSLTSNYIRDGDDELDITTMDGVTKQYRSSGKKYR